MEFEYQNMKKRKLFKKIPAKTTKNKEIFLPKSGEPLQLGGSPRPFWIYNKVISLSLGT